MAPNDKQWACEQIETRLSDYLDRLLTAAERGGFEEHVAGHARCAHGKERLARLDGLAAADLAAAIRLRRSERAGHGRRAFPGPGLPMAQADAGGSEPGEHVPGGRSPRPHHLRPRHEVCHRPARGIRDSVAPATRGRTAAGT